MGHLHGVSKRKNRSKKIKTNKETNSKVKNSRKNKIKSKDKESYNQAQF
jgi:hypothetical protein